LSLLFLAQNQVTSIIHPSRSNAQYVTKRSWLESDSANSS
ncbi:hypothetical protein LINPERPRIM_LOCUS1913, partial [Linum perenne]